MRKNDGYITVAEVAALCKVTVDAVHKWRGRYDDFPQENRTYHTLRFKRGPMMKWLRKHRKLARV